MANEITKEIRQELKELADKLLPIPKLRKGKNGTYETIGEVISISGSRLLEMNPEAKHKNGSPIKKNLMYVIENPEPSMMTAKNHFDKLVEAFYKDGYKGVLEYSTHVKDTYKKILEEKQPKEEVKEEEKSQEGVKNEEV
jgi:hypothetical protein